MSSHETLTRPDSAAPSTGPHPVDRVPPLHKLLVFGLQHLCIMYAGAVAVPLIVGPAVGLNSAQIAALVSADLLVSGIATIIQSAGISNVLGVRLPVVAGATFTVLNPMIIIATEYGGVKGLPYVYGAMMISGVLGLILAKPFSMIIRFFPPLVAGTVICIIGLSLGGADISLIAPTVVNGANVAEVSHVVLAGIVILSIILISRLFRGFVSQIAVLLSIVIGTIAAALMGQTDFSNVGPCRLVRRARNLALRRSEVRRRADHHDVHRDGGHVHRVDRGHARGRRDGGPGSGPQ